MTIFANKLSEVQMAVRVQELAFYRRQKSMTLNTKLHEYMWDLNSEAWDKFEEMLKEYEEKHHD